MSREVNLLIAVAFLLVLSSAYIWSYMWIIETLKEIRDELKRQGKEPK